MMQGQNLKWLLLVWIPGTYQGMNPLCIISLNFGRTPPRGSITTLHWRFSKLCFMKDKWLLKFIELLRIRMRFGFLWPHILILAAVKEKSCRALLYQEAQALSPANFQTWFQERIPIYVCVQCSAIISTIAIFDSWLRILFNAARSAFSPLTHGSSQCHK